MDNVGIVVDDLTATIDFFLELGLELEGRAMVEGEWAGRVSGLDDQRVEIAMMRTPDGHGRLELSRFLMPSAPGLTGPKAGASEAAFGSGRPTLHAVQRCSRSRVGRYHGVRPCAVFDSVRLGLNSMRTDARHTRFVVLRSTQRTT